MSMGIEMLAAEARERVWHRRFLKMAQLVASWSKDPSTKVGAIIVNHKRQVCGTGYNGFPRGIEDTDERLNDRPTKYALVVHAEANAILSATCADLDDFDLYVTHMPCTGCAKLIIQSGVGTVYVPLHTATLPTWSEEQEAAVEMLAEAEIILRHIQLD